MMENAGPVISPMRYDALGTGNAATFTGYWMPIFADACAGCSFAVHYGAVVGTWKVEVSNDPRCYANHPDLASAKTVDITSALSITNPAGVAGNDIIVIGNLRVGYVRLSYTHTSGTDTMETYFCAVGS